MVMIVCTDSKWTSAIKDIRPNNVYKAKLEDDMKIIGVACLSQSDRKSGCFILTISAYYNNLPFPKFVFVKMNSTFFLYMYSFVSECFILHCTNFSFSKEFKGCWIYYLSLCTNEHAALCQEDYLDFRWNSLSGSLDTDLLRNISIQCYYNNTGARWLDKMENHMSPGSPAIITMVLI